MDIDLYSRQLYTIGRNAMEKFIKGKILLINLSDSGLELVKNLVLMGIGEVNIYHKEKINLNDINNLFYLTNYDINKSMKDIILPKLRRLNPYVKISFIDNIDYINYDLVILNDINIDKAIEIDEKSKKFIWIKNQMIFNNFNEHMIIDIDGEEYNDRYIKEVKDNIITTTEKLEIDNNFRIKIINEGKELEINKYEIISWNRIKINEKIDIDINDKLRFYRLPIIINHKKLRDYKLDIEYLKETENNVIINSIIGGMSASEVFKGLTNKYTPFNQIWYYNENIKMDHLKLDKIRILMVGCGAIGCELLKNFTHMGIRNIIMTDMDKIEKSNLNRQFLFHHEDINEFKSITAKKKILEMNTLMNIQANIDFMGKETEDKYNSSFYSNIDIIVNALDNVVARKYMDEQAIKYELPLFESGTLGTKGNTQVILPHLTESYGSSNDPEEASIPLCTLKNFPNKIEHTIQWAKEVFEEEFFIKIKEVDYEKYWRDLYEELYIEKIKNLLKEFPKDHKIEDKLFWSNGKICPEIIELDQMGEELIKLSSSLHQNIVNLYKTKDIEYHFDKDNDIDIKIVTLLSNLRARIYKIEIKDEFETKKIAGKIIPALPTTTSIVAGLVCNEILKYTNNCNLVDYRNTYLNLAIPFYNYSEPFEATKNEFGLTLWSKCEINKEFTIEQVINFIKEKYNVDISMILRNQEMIYSFFDESNKNQIIKDLFKDSDDIIISGMEDEDLPRIKLI